MKHNISIILFYIALVLLINYACFAFISGLDIETNNISVVINCNDNFICLDEKPIIRERNTLIDLFNKDSTIKHFPSRFKPFHRLETYNCTTTNVPLVTRINSYHFVSINKINDSYQLVCEELFNNVKDFSDTIKWIIDNKPSC